MNRGAHSAPGPAGLDQGARMQMTKSALEVEESPPRKEGSLNLPNLLTSLRLLLVPVFVVLFEAGNPARAGLSAAVFAVAVATDWLDGYAARRSGQTTRIGKLLDPIADKVLIAAALIILVDAGRATAWLAVLLIGRDFVVTGLRFVAATGGQIIAADAGGKLKMGVQTGACFLLIGSDAVSGFPAETLGTVGLWGSLILSYYSAVRYVRQYGAARLQQGGSRS